MIIPSLYSGLQGKEAVPAVALVPGTLFRRANMTTKEPSLGYVPPEQMHKQPMMNDCTSIDTSRRVIHCKNDLRIFIGRPPKDKFALNQTSGVGRKTSSIFPREYANNGKIMVTSDSQVASKLNKLGLPR